MKQTNDNIFADLGLKDAEEMRIRSDLMSEVVHIIKNSGLPQKEIAKILKITASKVSALMNGKINDFSNDSLMNYLTLLGCDIEVKVSLRSPRKLLKSVKRGKINVKRTAMKKASKPSAHRAGRTKTKI